MEENYKKTSEMLEKEVEKMINDGFAEEVVAEIEKKIQNAKKNRISTKRTLAIFVAITAMCLALVVLNCGPRESINAIDCLSISTVVVILHYHIVNYFDSLSESDLEISKLESDLEFMKSEIIGRNILSRMKSDEYE